ERRELGREPHREPDPCPRRQSERVDSQHRVTRLHPSSVPGAGAFYSAARQVDTICLVPLDARCRSGRRIIVSEERDSFPNGVEATLLLVVLFALEIGVAEVLTAFGLFSKVDAIGSWGIITVIGNGLLFSVL